MIRFAVYHWLPIADNMLPDIEIELKKHYGETRVQLDALGTSEAISYKLKFSPKSQDGNEIGHFYIRGLINIRGFTQHVLEVPLIPGLSPSSVIDTIVHQMLDYTVDVLVDVIPHAVRNKLAVLQEGIVSFQSFRSTNFPPQIKKPATSFLKTYSVVTIMLNKEYRDDIRIGFDLPNLGLNISETYKSNFTLVCQNEKCFLFYSEEFNQEESQELGGIIYKYCALLVFMRFVAYVIEILKLVRDHVIPLRRELVIKLQRNTEEHFVWLTELKKYLTYINVKLPVVNKVLNHLNTAQSSEHFREKIGSLNSPDKLILNPSINSITELKSTPRLNPAYIIRKIDEDIQRLHDLYNEDVEEIGVLSDELSEVLEGNLMSESVQILARSLDTSRLLVEMERGGKNRNNALKWLSIAAIANIGALIAVLILEFLEMLFKSSGGVFGLIIRAFFIVAVPFFAWFYVNSYTQNRASIFRILIPILQPLPPIAITGLTQGKKLLRNDNFGSRRQRTWSEYLNSKQKVRKINPFSFLNGNGKKFDMTIDYEMRGYVYSVTLEKEYKDANFDLRDLVVQTIELIDNAGGYIYRFKDKKPDQETSLLAEVLQNINENLDSDLTALNRILTMPCEVLKQELLDFLRYRENISLAEEDIIFLEHIINKRDDYVKWFLDLQKIKDPYMQKLLKLLGEKNVEMKKDIIMAIQNEAEKIAPIVSI